MPLTMLYFRSIALRKKDCKENMKKFLLLLIVLLLLVGGGIYFTGFGLTYFEKAVPKVELFIEPMPNELPAIKVAVSDLDSELKSLSVKAEQNGTVTDLLVKEFDSPVNKNEVLIPLSKFQALKEGTILVTAKVSDTSFWSNSSEVTLPILIDFSAPRIQLLSLQHVAAQGGVEFVVYKAMDSNMKSHGVQVGDYFFPGFQAGAADLALNEQKDLQVTLFALPLGYEFGTAGPFIRAEDTAGNVTTVPLHFRLEKKAQASVTMNLKDDFLQRKNAELFPAYRRFAAEKGEQLQEKPADMPDLVYQFRLVNQNYRKLLDRKLLEISRASEQPRLWKETFIKPMGSATSSTFGEKRSYVYNGIDASGSVHNGLDLASVQADAVHAANDGIVALAGEFGIYGNAVFVDHGLGLFSLYGHLSSILVAVGDKITINQEIGRTGQTGLAGGDHLHFEFRIREVPVTPIEWWDSKWIKDNIDGKLNEFKTK